MVALIDFAPLASFLELVLYALHVAAIDVLVY
jgi:hypothetical protein